MTRPAEDGQLAGAEAAVFGLLVLVSGILLVANAWGVVDAKLAAASAAREAARAYVEAADEAAAASDARTAAAGAMSGHGRDPARMELDVRGDGFRRCGRVTAEVSYRVPLITIPVIGRFGTGFHAAARHSELVDPHRSGLPGVAECEAAR